MKITQKIASSILLTALISGGMLHAEKPPLPDMDYSFMEARAYTKGDRLVVSTGKIQQTWKWTGKGLVTVSVKALDTGREWCVLEPAVQSDWRYQGLIENDTECRLVHLEATRDNDENFTSDHIRIVAEFEYETKIALKLEIWAYPGAPGLRTQLFVKELHGMDRFLALDQNAGMTSDKPLPSQGPDRVNYLPINWSGLNRRAIGYYTGTQIRNKANTPILEEQLVTGTFLQDEEYSWSSILVAEDSMGGLALIDENHKCANQPGLNTGSFYITHDGLTNTGWGLSMPFFLADRYRSAWATWTLLYTGGDVARETAIKNFDRTRYPIDPERDIYILANTWGSGNHRLASKETNVLIELESQADLGIDVQQIDDGWQNPEDLHWTRTTKWEPYPTMYPEGWVNVVEKAKEVGVTLGLWQAAGMHSVQNRKMLGDHSAKLEDLKRNFNQGGFRYYKFDFTLIEDYDDLEQLLQQTREFQKYTDNKVRVNWDVTEVEPRIGYFFGREYGNLYLENRKPKLRKDTVYVPYLVLRDAWQVAKYVNLNKVQVTVQNIDRTDRQVSNAHLYTHPYSVAITLMSSPIFFQETHLYSDQARDEIRELLTIYKANREKMYQGFVYPIGEMPDDHSWAGFQCHLDESNEGYLMLFRELNNEEPEKAIQLNFLPNARLEVTDLISGKSFHMDTDSSGVTEFQIPKTPDFRYLYYKVVSQ